MAKLRLQFKGDGSGFAYYGNGRVAACALMVNRDASRYSFYADDRQTTPLCALDEHAVGAERPVDLMSLLLLVDDGGGTLIGFAVGEGGERLVLSGKGGLLSGADGNIVTEWKWDRAAQHCGALPQAPLELRLNGSMTVVFTSRSDIIVRLSFDDGGGGSRDFAVGLKAKRASSLEKNPTKKTRSLTGGALSVSVSCPSLVERTHAFGEAAKELRSRLHPKSSALTLRGAKAVVEGLEGYFDGYDQAHSGAREFGSQWRARAFASTTQELPRIALTGTECGVTTGLGTTIYGASPEPPLGETGDGGGGESEPTTRTRSRTSSSPVFLYETSGPALRTGLMRNNPLLARSGVLCAASGRYTDDIVVPGGKRSATNPTGKTESSRRPLRSVAPADLGDFVARRIHHRGELVCVACVRPDDRASRRALAVAESVNGGLEEGIFAQDTTNTDDDAKKALRKQFTLVAVDFSVSKHAADAYRVSALPAFLMFYDGRLCFRGQLGGERVRVAPDACPLKMLQVEPKVSDQPWTEKMLKKKFRDRTALALNAAQALKTDHIWAQSSSSMRSMPGAASSFDVVLVSASTTADDAAAIQRHFLATTTMTSKRAKKVLLCGLAELSGPEGSARAGAALWQGRRSGVSTDVDLLLPDHIAAVVEVCITKPIKSTALDDLVDYYARAHADAAHPSGGADDDADADDDDGSPHKGLTRRALFTAMEGALAAAKRGAFLPADPPLRAAAKTHAKLARPRRDPFAAPGLDVTLESLIHKSFDRSFDPS